MLDIEKFEKGDIIIFLDHSKAIYQATETEKGLFWAFGDQILKIKRGKKIIYKRG